MSGVSGRGLALTCASLPRFASLSVRCVDTAAASSPGSREFCLIVRPARRLRKCGIVSRSACAELPGWYRCPGAGAGLCRGAFYHGRPGARGSTGFRAACSILSSRIS